MAKCNNCGAIIPDGCDYCVECGEPLSRQRAGVIDHTSEFSQTDISDNKVMALFMYLNGLLGLIAALLSQHSRFVRFHLRQSLKITVLNTVITMVSLLATLALGVLFGIPALIMLWTGSFGGLQGIMTVYSVLAGIIGLAVVIFKVVLFVVRIQCFFNVCKGKAVEAAIVRNMKFMR